MWLQVRPIANWLHHDCLCVLLYNWQEGKQEPNLHSWQQKRPKNCGSSSLITRNQADQSKTHWSIETSPYSGPRKWSCRDIPYTCFTHIYVHIAPIVSRRDSTWFDLQGFMGIKKAQTFGIPGDQLSSQSFDRYQHQDTQSRAHDVSLIRWQGGY